MLRDENSEKKQKEHRIMEMYNRDNDKSLIDEPKYQAEKLDLIFNDFYQFAHFIMNSPVTDESIDNCRDIINELHELINHFTKPNSDQFDFLIQFIWVLNNHNDYKQLKEQLIYTTIKLIDIYPELIDDFLSSESVSSFIDIYSGVFLGYDLKLLSTIIDKSGNALNILISNDLLGSIFKGVTKTVLQMFPDFDKEEKITAKVISEDYYESKKLIINYWLNALKILQKISTEYTADNSIQIQIFNFCIKFITIDFYRISPGFFFRVIDCICSCLIHFETPELFNIDDYLSFLINTLNGDYFELRESIFNLFNIVTQKPFFYKWDQEIILSLSANAINWYNSKDFQNYFNYFSNFIDFISNVIQNQFETFDTLNSASIFNQIFDIFQTESFKLKNHIINLFLNLAYPEIWPKTVTFYAENQIITELLLFVSSSQVDEEFLKKIINCLFQVSDENFLNPYPSQKAAIVSELKSDIVESALGCFEDENSIISEMISKLKDQINSL